MIVTLQDKSTLCVKLLTGESRDTVNFPHYRNQCVSVDFAVGLEYVLLNDTVTDLYFYDCKTIRTDIRCHHVVDKDQTQ